MKNKILTPIISAGIIWTATANGSEKVISKADKFEIVIEIEDDGQSSVAQLRANGKLLQTSENIFELVKLVPPAEQKILLSQIIENEIKNAGGLNNYQESINENLKRFGNDFYKYMDEPTKEAYAQKGISLSLKEEKEQQKKETVSGEEEKFSDEAIVEEETPQTSIEW